MIDVKNFLKQTFNTDVIENKANQLTWLSWYKNTNNWRNYYVTLANEKRSKKQYTRHSLFSCKRVCEDWANLLLNEKTDIVVSNSDNTLNQALHDVLSYNDFWTLGNKAIEKVFALGAGSFVTSMDTNGKITIEFVDGTRCYVLKCNADDVVDCAFENTTYIKGKKYTILTVHKKNEDNDEYIIYNYLFDEDGGIQSEETMQQLLQVSSQTPSKIKTFAFLTPQNLARNNWDTPFADSIFSKAVDANKMIDLAFDSYCNEFILGKKRIFVASELVSYARETTKDGKSSTTTIPIFDENEVVFNLLNQQENGETLIKEVDMKLRVAEHQQGIQDALNFFASLCGLGEKYYKYDQGSIATATQIVSENSVLFRNIQKQQIQIEKCLKEVCNAIFGLLGVEIRESTEVTIQFDDSIIEDKDTERKRDLLDVDKGIMSKAEYRSKWYGETIEEAQKIIDEIEGAEAEKELKKNADNEKFLI